MIKKLAAVLLAAVTMTTTAAFAAGVSGILTEESITIFTQDKNRMILNGYDENGRLSVSGMFTSEDGAFSGIPEKFAGYRLRAGFLDGGVIDVTVTEATPVPTETPIPAATAKPAATPAPVPAKPSFPGIYERQIDAVEAIAVVDSVSYGENVDSEECCYIKALYRGSEVSFEVKKDVSVSEASDAFSYMTGLDMGALKRGDVICVTSDLSGDINRVGFIYRPLEKNIVTDGNNYGNSFEKLISDNGSVAGRNGWGVLTPKGGSAKNQLAFGVISERYNKSLILLGADGDENNALDLSLEDGTIVYICDMASRNELSVKGISGIEKSSIPKSAVSGDGIVTYSDGFKTNYALARVVKGTVTDIVIYKNYNR